ncbi:hypothetical protein ADN01_15095 [Levilinea saccharolytica]|uniref:Uncharacterized protein n=1 Tax=Levilinea saccharolytica TaxID=229921 RepID=A0A0P6Y9P4_9CHLR|nr:hypothetical protein ADN01_15095 [Levilinea saccharolytica]
MMDLLIQQDPHCKILLLYLKMGRGKRKRDCRNILPVVLDSQRFICWFDTPFPKKCDMIVSSNSITRLTRDCQERTL